jgi:hypothetical protein
MIDDKTLRFLIGYPGEKRVFVTLKKGILSWKPGYKYY